MLGSLQELFLEVFLDSMLCTALSLCTRFQTVKQLILPFSLLWSLLWLRNFCLFKISFFFFHQEMWNQRLKKYEEELKRRNIEEQSTEFHESL